jgi:lipopolysaccharide export system protein LptA
MKNRLTLYCALGFVALIGITLLSHNGAPIKEDTATSVTNAVLYGPASNGGSYNMQIAQAKQIEASTYELYSISAQYYLDPTKTKYVTMTSAQGAFDSRHNLLKLTKEIKASSHDGYKLVTDLLEVDMNRKVLFTSANATVSGSMGQIVSESGFTHDFNASTTLLTGPTTTTYHGKGTPPIVIKANQVSANSLTNMLVYSGDVTITQKGSTFKCTKVDVLYNRSGDKGGEKIEKADFHGGITITNGDKVAVGDTASYSAKDHMVVVKGNTALRDKHGYMEGEQITYDTQTEVFKIVGPKQAGNEGRVRAIITP